ncbi:glyceraldehyde-3-phosphate dehydrogenase [Streptomyces viridochromogenes]|uniref:Putative Glyceraldehyde-3-phosphate dehydrogenase, type I n=1 Tax=Streptomyces viridochromogenes Tue57 TaxID=1160705 RepID=L8PAW2_STRVR|nr:putative Glyceraldehyde-3-phosphate dehydrogenase, type I [Streptomyces viridochromogenes Tue57]
MAVRVGIDGYGRIGRTYLRAALDRAEAGTQDVEVATVIELSSCATARPLCPNVESSSSRWARVAGEVMSLIASRRLAAPAVKGGGPP